jgi:hypothetical protein
LSHPGLRSVGSRSHAVLFGRFDESLDATVIGEVHEPRVGIKRNGRLVEHRRRVCNMTDHL